VAVTFESRGQSVAAAIRLAESPQVEVVTLEEAGQTPTAAQLAFRQRWLGDRAAAPR
jgi:predicted metalloprotease with PDZ domain